MSRAGEFLSNLATFLLALLLAVFIWTTASETEDPVRTRFIEVPLQIVGLPPNAVLVNYDPRQIVQIRLEAPDSVLQEVVPDDFEAVADVSNVTPGVVTTVDITVTNKKPKADISFITPEQIDIQLEEQVTREIPVELDLRGSVARGHTQGEPLVDPPTIRVTGPGSRVNQLNFALVTVFLNNAVETLVETALPIFYDQSGRVASVTGLDQSASQVRVTVPIEEAAGFADKLVTVEWVGEPAPGYRLLSVKADPPSVLVEGRPAQVNRLTSVKTEPVDINGLTQTFQQVAVLDLPDGITVDPEQTVTVTIEVEPILTTSTFIRTPQLRGLRPDYDAVAVPEQVRVVLFGPLPVLDSLAENDVRVILDLFGLEPGTYSVEPEVDIPDNRGIELRSVQPAAVSVTITPTITNTESLVPLMPIVAASDLTTAGSEKAAVTVGHRDMPTEVFGGLLPDRPHVSENRWRDRRDRGIWL